MDAKVSGIGSRLPSGFGILKMYAHDSCHVAHDRLNMSFEYMHLIRISSHLDMELMIEGFCDDELGVMAYNGAELRWL